MSLSKKDMNERRKRQKEIFSKLYDFFEEHPGKYFTEPEISKRIGMQLIEFSYILESMVLIEDYGDVEKICKKGKFYFGKEVKKNE